VSLVNSVPRPVELSLEPCLSMLKFLLSGISFAVFEKYLG